MASGIKIENLKKSFNSAKGVITPIDNFSLDISANELTTVIGKSGCGKTTLLKLISGENFIRVPRSSASSLENGRTES